MKQLSFMDAEYAGTRKETRREVFLAEMAQVVPWKTLPSLIEPLHPVAGRAAIRIRPEQASREPVFGFIKQVLGFRQFRLRGEHKVDGVWDAVSMAYNLKRMHVTCA
jgi:hypothetical protein